MRALIEALTATGALALAEAARRPVLWAVGLLLCLALLLVGCAFLTFGAYRALADAAGAIHASLAVGGCYLVLALVGLLIVQSRR